MSTRSPSWCCKDNTTINSFDDLAGKTVETGTGYKAQFIMEDYNAAASQPEDQHRRPTTRRRRSTTWQSGRVDAMFLDTPIAKWYGANDSSGLTRSSAAT